MREVRINPYQALRELNEVVPPVDEGASMGPIREDARAAVEVSGRSVLNDDVESDPPKIGRKELLQPHPVRVALRSSRTANAVAHHPSCATHPTLASNPPQ
jgi:hypothetical protein